MSNALTDMRFIRFLLYEVHNVEEVLEFPFFQDHSRETFDMAIDAAYQLAQEVFWPAYQEFDQEGARFDGKQVYLPKAMHDIWRHCKEGGWFAPNVSFEEGGQQFPLSIFAVSSFLFSCGNTAAAMYVNGTWGAAMLIHKFGCQALQEKYMSKLYSGEWGGTMALTEPDVGTSLGDIKTTAVKAADGDYYQITGTKRFISSGDHDLSVNIVHPVLARIQGAPPGVKGISLFVVPKYRVNNDGSIGEFNDVITAGIEHKMGLKGQATATLNLGEHGNCRGWLIGEPNEGLKYMFELMNRARVFTGIQAVSGASVAYQAALEYCKERLQGREITCRDATAPQIAIIHHADVRSMLLKQKAFIEGALGMVMFCAKLADCFENTTDEEEKQRINLILEMMTPCCKAHFSNVSVESITQAMQCFGGAGYCEEFPVAQLLRDNKVFSIYEGANGIQAMDLLGRKVPMEAGAAVRALMMEMGTTIAEASALETLKELQEKVQEVQNEVIAATMYLGGIGMSGQVNEYICNATMYLEMFSQLLMGWQHLKQAIVAQRVLDAGTDEADFYHGKIETARFYINTVLPHAVSSAKILQSNEYTALNFKPEWF